MDGTVPKIFYNFYLNFMNFLIFFKFQGDGLKISNFLRGGPDLWSGGAGPLGPPAATPLEPRIIFIIKVIPHFFTTYVFEQLSLMLKIYFTLDNILSISFKNNF